MKQYKKIKKRYAIKLKPQKALLAVVVWCVNSMKTHDLQKSGRFVI